MCAQDAERAAREQAGLLPPGRRRRRLAAAAAGDSTAPSINATSAAPPANTSPVVVMASLTPLPLHLVPNQGGEAMGARRRAQAAPRGQNPPLNRTHTGLFDGTPQVT